MLIFNGKKYFVPIFTIPEGIVGTWVFKETIDLPPKDFELQFTSNGVSYAAIETGDGQLYYSDVLEDETEPAFSTKNGWAYEEYRTINITQESTDKEFIEWLKSNAEKPIEGVDTCTVNVEFSIKPSNGIVGATTFSVGTISSFNSRQTEIGTITIPNVLCGSALFIDVGTYASLYGWSYGHQINGASTSFVLNVPSEAGTYTAEIGVLDD